ncbi:MAG: formylglycine-generating enzyme family protein, partial [Maribacter sp.]|nr:formylglycine-generating enzyme family protein [Maribacter sp.]
WWREVILLSLALNNPSIIEAFMKELIPTEKFLSEISIVEDAVQDSIEKPTGPFIDAVSNEKLQPEAKYNAIRIMRSISGDKVIQALKNTTESGDRKLALTAYEALNSLNEAEGVIKPVEELPTTYENRTDNSKMVLIPAGTFLFGSRDDDKMANSNEKPQRTIDLPAFYMDVNPVTNDQFCKFLNSESPDKQSLEKWINLEGSYEKEKCRIIRKRRTFNVEKGYESNPIIYVTWYGAAAYAKWAGKKLPTEQEWEKAARSTDGRIYPWGNKFNKKFCNSDESEIGKTSEIGKFPEGKSFYGCHDMAGNVWEWTNSNYDNKKDTFVLRGGSWLYGSGRCRCAFRFVNDPILRNHFIGFRCARTLIL